MAEVTLSSKFQVAIPKKIREASNLRPKQKLIIVHKAGTITLVPEVLLSKLRGKLPGLDLKNIRDEKDRI